MSAQLFWLSTRQNATQISETFYRFHNFITKDTWILQFLLIYDKM